MYMYDDILCFGGSLWRAPGAYVVVPSPSNKVWVPRFKELWQDSAELPWSRDANGNLFTERCDMRSDVSFAAPGW